ncbi:MAG: anthranilate synthase component I family protein [Fibrobacterales bacterium]
MLHTINPQINDPWKLFQRMSQHEKNGFYFDNWGGAGVTYFGYNPSRILEGKANESDQKIYDKIDKLLVKKATDHSQKYAFESGVVGLIGYNLCAEFESYPRKKEYHSTTPDYHIGLYDRIFIYDHTEECFYCSTYNDTDVDHGEFEESWRVAYESDHGWTADNFKQSAGKKVYEKYVEETVEYIHAGDVFQANLAHPIHFDFTGSPLDLFSKIRTQNPSPYNSYYFTPEFTVVSNSPELLYGVSGRKVTTKPIAGTRRRGEDAEDEEALKKELFISEKEQAEHLMLVDLERNDLGRFCEIGSVLVEKFMDCELYKDVMHIVSTVTGVAKPDVSSAEMLQHLFPGGTITGAPKIRSIEIIDALENADRKFYTGSLGFFDHSGSAETNILIRTLLVQKGMGEMHFGAGIVADSIPEHEYEETMHKAASWMKMLTRQR